MTRRIQVGAVPVGGGAPVSIQSMCNTATEDVEATVQQIRRLEQAGCDIVRVAVPTEEAARAIPAIKRGIRIPLVADIHFDYKLALLCIDGGVDKIRINPGNIGSKERVRAVADGCRERGIPIRVGVNGGSLEKDLLRKYGGVTAEALAESALGHVRLLEDCGFGDICISVKCSRVPVNMAAYELLHERVDYPLHLGVTFPVKGLPHTIPLSPFWALIPRKCSSTRRRSYCCASICCRASCAAWGSVSPHSICTSSVRASRSSTPLTAQASCSSSRSWRGA